MDRIRVTSLDGFTSLFKAKEGGEQDKSRWHRRPGRTGIVAIEISDRFVMD